MYTKHKPFKRLNIPSWKNSPVNADKIVSILNKNRVRIDL